MFRTTDILFAVMGLATLAFSWYRDAKKTKKALKIGAKRFLMIFPTLFAVFVLIGLLEVFVPRQWIVATMGSARGLLAPFSAAVVGGFLAGSPAASYALAKFLLKYGASIAAVATFIIAWVSVGTISLPIEIRYFGAKFTWMRWMLTLVFSIIIGVLMGWLM